MTIEQPEVKDLTIEKIHSNPWNPNEMSEERFNQLKKDMKEKGYLQFILARESPKENGMYEIVDGEHRWKAAKEVGVDSLKTIVAEIPDDNEARKTTLNMNDIKGTDNPVALAEVLDSLTEEESAEELEQDLVMSRQEIEQHEMLLDLPDEQDIEEIDEQIDDEDTEDVIEVNLQFMETQLEQVIEELDTNRENLEHKLKTYIEQNLL